MAAKLARKLDLQHLVVVESIDGVLAALSTKSSIIKEIKKSQHSNSKIKALKDKVKQGCIPDFQVGEDDTLYMKRRLCVPKSGEM